MCSRRFPAPRSGPLQLRTLGCSSARGRRSASPVEPVQPRESPRLACCFLDESGITEGTPRRIAGLLRQKLIFLLLLRFQFQVRLQLALQILFPLLPPPTHVAPPGW